MGKILRDLVNIEINTIVTEVISGIKIPELEFAVYDIAKCYLIILNSLDRKTTDAMEDVRIDSAAFEDFHKRASRLMEENDELSPEDILSLKRVRFMSGQLGPTLKSAEDKGYKITTVGELKNQGNSASSPKLDIENRDRLLIRKAWELTRDPIAIQTVVQLDGDVITRILPEYCDKDYEILHRIHQQGVNCAVGFWKGLGELFASIISFGKSK